MQNQAPEAEGCRYEKINSKLILSFRFDPLYPVYLISQIARAFQSLGNPILLQSI